MYKPIKIKKFTYEHWWTVERPNLNLSTVTYGNERVKRMIERKEKRHTRKVAHKERIRESNRYFCDMCYPQCGSCR